jgi:hypothetical protein
MKTERERGNAGHVSSVHAARCPRCQRQRGKRMPLIERTPCASSHRAILRVVVEAMDCTSANVCADTLQHTATKCETMIGAGYSFGGLDSSAGGLGFPCNTSVT